jgi:uncharacterized protein (DUF488 family)
MKHFCYSIGHSNHCFEQFRDLLLYHGITLVVDVRSVPYSKFVPQYNREELREQLGWEGISYLYAGKELGGRNRVPASLEEAVESPEFQAGLAALLTRIAAGEVVAIMCAERDPFNCHRFYLVSYALEERGIEVRHVLETGNAVPTELLEERLIEAYHDGLFQLSLFGEGDVRKDAVRRAYGRRYQDVARKSG